MTTTAHAGHLTQPQGRKHRSILAWIGRGVLALLALIALLAAAGFLYETVMAAGDAARYPAPGQMVDVGGHKLHIRCVGEGSPTVVLEGGSGGTSIDWSLTQPVIGQHTRVCAYERAGNGWSEPGPLPRTPQLIVAELAMLLRNSGEAGPYVLVGHSLGGRYVRLFAETYPEQVAGMVLVDARHEYHDQAMTEAEREQFTALVAQNNNLSMVLGRLGFIRAFGAALNSSDPTLQALPTESLQAMIVMSDDVERNRAILSEIVEREASDDVLAAATFGDLPLQVLVSEEPMAVDPNWLPGQELQAGISTNSTLTILPAGHYLQLGAPEQVVASILAVAGK